MTVLGDELRLRQVAANLLSNAQVHTPPGTAVRVKVSAVGDRARLEVSDDGPGLAPEAAERVFERFFRVDKARSRATGGAGLGLSIVAAIAEVHGGDGPPGTPVPRPPGRHLRGRAAPARRRVNAARSGGAAARAAGTGPSSRWLTLQDETALTVVEAGLRLPAPS